MIGDKERRYTVDNNITGTHNICSALVDLSPSTHLVHLGTMGVYGYSKDFGSIPEGYLNIKINQTHRGHRYSLSSKSWKHLSYDKVS